MNHSDECLHPDDVPDVIGNGDYDIEVYQQARELGMSHPREKQIEILLGEHEAKVRERKALRNASPPPGTPEEEWRSYYRTLNGYHQEESNLLGDILALIRGGSREA